MKMMLMLIMINISFLSRQVEGRITTATSISGYEVQLICTSEVHGDCTTGSWLSNKTGVTFGTCIQICMSNIGVENKFHSNETSLIATIVNWNWTVDNSVWKCQCGTDVAVIVVTPPQTTTVAPLLESATTTVAPVIENATMSVTSSLGSVVGGVIGGVGGVILVVLVVLFICKRRTLGRCLNRRQKQDEDINSASSPMLPAITPSREQPVSQRPHQLTADLKDEDINSASSPMLPAITPSREQPVSQRPHQFTADLKDEDINSASSSMLPAITPSREQPVSQRPHQFTADFKCGSHICMDDVTWLCMREPDIYGQTSPSSVCGYHIFMAQESDVY